MTALGAAESVGMGGLAVAKAPGALEIRGLGSCIALALHDPLQRLVGLAHIVIPRPLPNTPPAPAWAATTAIPALLDAMEARGARTNRLVARIAGGASMYPGPRKGYEVGPENADIVDALLQAYKIPVLSRQVGGQASRSVVLHAADGRLDVRTNRAPPQQARARGGPDPREAIRMLLEAVATPLADVLQRPIGVDAEGLYDLTLPEALDFLGPHTRMLWSQLNYHAPEGPMTLRLAIPATHATRIDEELRGRLGEPTGESSAITEVLNIMLSHALTTLARLQGVVLRPLSVQVHRGTTESLVGSLPRDPARATLRVAHGRLHLEGAFRGAELALLGAGIP